MKEAIEQGWRALNLGSTAREWNGDFCRCDPDVGAVPCEYCALHKALTAADKLLTTFKEEKE